MDLRDLTPENDTVVCTVVHPIKREPLKNDDGSDMTIELYAPYSDEYKKVMFEQQNKRLAKAKGGKIDIKAEELDEASVELLSKVTKSWDITFGGEKPKLSPTKAKEVYKEVFWIRQQLEEAIDDSLSFMMK